MLDRKCIFCNKVLQTRHQVKFCSNRCQSDFKYKDYILNWKKNQGKAVSSKNISKHIKRHLIDMCGEKCSMCGWKERNPTSNNIPMEVDHIDGNANNNSEENLRLLCPNCHALTPHFRNLNKGNGREWRLKNKVVMKSLAT